MYLTDYRQRSLKDVITQLEPGLFKKVTGLDVKDFELLVSLNVFNGSLMNDAIFKFKRYEDSSLSYTGIDKHAGEDIGGWDTVIKRSEYESLFYNQQSTMEAMAVVAEDIPDTSFMGFMDEDDEPEEESIPAKPVKTVSPAPRSHPIPIAKIAHTVDNAYQSDAKTEKPTATRARAKQTPVAPPMPDFVTTAYGVKSPVVPAPIKKEVKPHVDTSGVAVGVTVEHKVFGAGKVIELGGGSITISFEQGQKRFEFPNAFDNGFLKVQEHTGVLGGRS